jgi:cell wall-associated NlpC family hydrolase
MLKKILLPILLPIIVSATPSIAYIHSAYSNGKDIAKSANKYLGVPYVWGGNSLTRGLDCSAFVKILVKTHTGINLPRTAQNQALKTKTSSSITSFSSLKVGDAIYFKNNTGHIHHVALVTGFDTDGYPFITHAKGKAYGVVREKITKKYIDEFYIGKRFANYEAKKIVRRISSKRVKSYKFYKNNSKYRPLLLKNI